MLPKKRIVGGICGKGGGIHENLLNYQTLRKRLKKLKRRFKNRVDRIREYIRRGNSVGEKA